MRKKSNRNFWLVLLAILLAILTLSLLDESNSPKKNEKRKIPDNRADKLKRLTQINQEISKYQKERLDYKSRERKLFLAARIVIGISLIIGNGFYFHWDYTKLSQEEVLTFNGTITLTYTFVAFVIYGNIQSFINSLKNIARKWMIGKSTLSIVEYRLLHDERTILINDLEKEEELQMS